MCHVAHPQAASTYPLLYSVHALGLECGSLALQFPLEKQESEVWKEKVCFLSHVKVDLAAPSHIGYI